MFGTPKGASAIVLDDDMRQPAEGKVRVRVVNAFGVVWPVDVAEPGGGTAVNSARTDAALPRTDRGVLFVGMCSGLVAATVLVMATRRRRVAEPGGPPEPYR